MRWSLRRMHYLSGIGALVLLEIMYLRPRWIFAIGFAAAVWFALSIFWETRALPAIPIKQRLKIISPFFLGALLLNWMTLGFSLLVEHYVWRQLIAVMSAVMIVIFFETMSAYIYRGAEYKDYALENITSYVLTLTVFFGSSMLYGLQGLLDIPAALAIIVFGLLISMMGGIFFWTSAIAGPAYFPASATVGLATLEIFTAFLVLPFHFVVSGAAVTVLWHLAVSLSRAWTLRTFTPEVLRRHLIFGTALIIILFVSVRWI